MAIYRQLQLASCELAEYDKVGIHRCVPKPEGKSVARRILELFAAAAVLLVILYWPTTNTGRLILIAAGVVCLVALKFLIKWPSA